MAESSGRSLVVLMTHGADDERSSVAFASVMHEQIKNGAATLSF